MLQFPLSKYQRRRRRRSRKKIVITLLGTHTIKKSITLKAYHPTSVQNSSPTHTSLSVWYNWSLPRWSWSDCQLYRTFCHDSRLSVLIIHTEMRRRTGNTLDKSWTAIQNEWGFSLKSFDKITLTAKAITSWKRTQKKDRTGEGQLFQKRIGRQKNPPRPGIDSATKH